MEKTTAYFKALADDTRLRILKLLEGGELCVCDITAALDMTQPNVSFHLGILKDAGIIKDRRAGRWSYYDLDMTSMVNRVVVTTALERIEGLKVKRDKERLARFKAVKAEAATCCLVKNI